MPTSTSFSASKKLLVVISLGLLISFIFFSYLVAKEQFTQFDFDTTVKLQDHISKKWDLSFSILSLLGSAEIVGALWLFLIGYFLVKRYYLTTISLVLLIGATIIEVFGKLFVLHPAPPHLFYRGVLNLNLPSHFVQTDYSYPSGHMIRTSFLISFLILLFFLKASKIKSLIFIPILVCIWILVFISRISLGEHWTSDVVGGALLGGSFGILAGITIPTTKKLKSLMETLKMKVL